MEQQHNEQLFQQQQAEQQRLEQEQAQQQYLQQQEAELLFQQQQAHFALQQEQDNQWAQQQNGQEDGQQFVQHQTEQHFQQTEQHLQQIDHHIQQQHIDQDQQADLQQVPEDHQQEDSVELFTEEEELPPLPANLQRRPSASRPTDIDDLILKHNTKMNSYSGESIYIVSRVRTLDLTPSPSEGLTHLDLNLEPVGGKETNVDDLWDDRDEVRFHRKNCSGYQLTALDTLFAPLHPCLRF